MEKSLKKIMCFIPCVLIILSQFSAVTGISNSGNDSSFLPLSHNEPERFVLISQPENNRVFTINTTGSVVWEKTGLNGPNDADFLINGNILITELYGNRVIEVNKAGSIVWSKTGLNMPHDADQTTTGNILISDTLNQRVIEVNNQGDVVWDKSGLNYPIEAERCPNGNTLIVECSNYADGRVIEVNPSGSIVWQKANLDYPFDAERLSNGNTLITEVNAGRVIEVNAAGTIVWQKTVILPIDAERLPNGNTLIGVMGSQNQVIEVNNAGTIVWQVNGITSFIDVEGVFTEAPDTPSLDGETNGKIGVSYPFTVCSTDPDDDTVYYYINWGDSTTSGWVGPFPSGEEQTISHTWIKKNTYLVQVKVKDIWGAESDWATLSVTMPCSYNLPFIQFWEQLFQQFPHAFPILRHLMGY